MRPFGIGATHPFQMFLWSAQEYREADLTLPDGGRVHFDRTSSATSFGDAVFLSTTHPGPFYKAELRWMGNITPDPDSSSFQHSMRATNTANIHAGEKTSLLD